MRRYGYCRWAEIDAELRAMDGHAGALGRLSDGVYECGVVAFELITRTEARVVLKHGQRIHVEEVPASIKSLLQEMTRFKFVSGGTAIFTIRGGKIDAVGKVEG